VKSYKSNALLACVAALGFAALARADQPAPAKKPETPAPAGQALTDESLQATLKDLGYTPTLEKAGSSNLYWVKVAREGTTYSVSFQISPNKEKVWAIVPLSDIPDIDKAAATRLGKLLELNDAIGPCYFRYNVANKRLYMSRPLDNRAATAALVRDTLDRIIDRCVETKEHWNCFNQSTQPPAAEAPKK